MSDVIFTIWTGTLYFILLISQLLTKDEIKYWDMPS